MSGMWNKGPYYISGYTDGRLTGPEGVIFPLFNENPEINARVADLCNKAYVQGQLNMQRKIKELLGIEENEYEV